VRATELPAMAVQPSKRRRRPARSRLVVRWLALGVTVLVGLLYVRPVQSYLDARGALAQRRAEVEELRREQRRLERQLAASTSAEALLVEARKLGFVREGERLFIVKGIPEWRKLRDRTIGGDG
jgi:cell division protein FtsB